MRFSSTRSDPTESSLGEALLAGYPPDGGLFCPSGEVDLRPAVYAPDASFLESAAWAVTAIFPESADPERASRLVADFAEPACHAAGPDILVVDLALGPTGSAADYGAGFAAALLAEESAATGGRILAVAAAEGREAAALAEAFSRRGLPLALLLSGPPPAIARPGVLAREGGTVSLLGVEGGGAAALERELSGLASGGFRLVPVGAGTPGRLAGRTVLLVALFSLARRGVAGDLILAAPPGDRFGVAVGLWAWSWGLPVTAFVSARRAEDPAPGPGGQAEELINRFSRELPPGALVIEESSSAAEASLAASELLARGGPALDRASSHALAAARRVLAAGLGGHARLVAPRFADPRWDLEAGEGGRGAGAREAAAGGFLDARGIADRGALLEALAGLAGS